MLESIYFWVFSLIAVCCGFGLLTARHPISGAIALVGVMLAIAGIYGLLAAPFLGIAQILVYAGAIMMLVVFVIMVLNSAKDRQTPRGSSFGPLGVILAVLFGLVVLAGLGRSRAALELHPEAVTGQAENVGLALFAFSGPAATGWFVLFEVVGLVLLSAMVGAVLLAKRSISSPKPVDEMVPAEGGH
jgi:NADH-quinone oxidoreductase subunit J